MDEDDNTHEISRQKIVGSLTDLKRYTLTKLFSATAPAFHRLG